MSKSTQKNTTMSDKIPFCLALIKTGLKLKVLGKNKGLLKSSFNFY